MEPAFWPGDMLLVWRCRKGRLRPGQVIIARSPAQPKMLIIKRVAWREPGGWWVSADNPRAGGVDSFRFGPVPAELVEGRVLARYWPLRWTRRGSGPSGPEPRTRG